MCRIRFIALTLFSFVLALIASFFSLASIKQPHDVSLAEISQATVSARFSASQFLDYKAENRTDLVLGQTLERSRFPPSAPAKDDSNFGAGIQRTMTLLASSTPEHRNPVRILFYGQSITQQDWWIDVANDLKKRFPYADLQIENRAIGGFDAGLLIRPAEHDLYPFYPDLTIFHVYGKDDD